MLNPREYKINKCLNKKIPKTLLDFKFYHNQCFSYSSSEDFVVHLPNATSSFMSFQVKIWFQNRRARERRDRENQMQQGGTPSASNPTGAGGSNPGNGPVHSVQRPPPGTPLSPGNSPMTRGPLGGWPLPTPPTASALAHFSHALHQHSNSAFTPVSFSAYWLAASRVGTLGHPHFNIPHKGVTATPNSRSGHSQILRGDYSSSVSNPAASNSAGQQQQQHPSHPRPSEGLAMDPLYLASDHQANFSPSPTLDISHAHMDHRRYQESNTGSQTNTLSKHYENRHIKREYIPDERPGCYVTNEYNMSEPPVSRVRCHSVSSPHYIKEPLSRSPSISSNPQQGPSIATPQRIEGLPSNCHANTRSPPSPRKSPSLRRIESPFEGPFDMRRSPYGTTPTDVDIVGVATSQEVQNVDSNIGHAGQSPSGADITKDPQIEETGRKTPSNFHEEVSTEGENSSIGTYSDCINQTDYKCSQNWSH